MILNPAQNEACPTSFREVLGAGLLLTLIGIFAYQSFFFPWNELAGSDYIALHHPYMAEMKRNLGEHWIPLWFSRAYAGAPALADIALVFTYPLHQLLHFFSATTVLKIESVWHLFSFVTGVYFLARSFEGTRRIAFLSGLIALTSFQYQSILDYGHLVILTAFAYYPWVIAFSHRFFKSKELSLFNGNLLAMALFQAILWNSSHPQHTFMTYEICVLILIFNWKDYREKLGAKVLLTLASGLVALAINAPQLYATLDYIAETGRASTKDDPNFLLSGSLHPADTLKWIHPEMFGPPQQFWGHQSFWYGHLFAMPFLWLFLLHGIKSIKKTYLFLFAFLLVLSLGKYTPLFIWHQTYVPGASMFRYSSRYLFILLPLLSIAIACGLDKSIRDSFHKVLLLPYLCLATLFGLLYFQPDFILNLFPKHVLERYPDEVSPTLTSTLILISIPLLLCYFSPSHKLKLIASVLLCSLIIAQNISKPFHSIHREEHIQAPQALGAPRNIVLNQNSFHNLPVEQGFNSITGYGGLVPRRFREFMDTQVLQNWDKQTRVQIHPMPAEAKSFLGIQNTYESLNQNLVPHKRIQNNSAIASRFHLKQDFEHLPLNEASKFYQSILQHQADLQKKFVAFKSQTGQTSDQKPNIEILSYQNEALEAKVQSPSPQVFIVADCWGPKWEASINGNPTDLHQWYGAFKAVFVPAGESIVKINYSRKNFQLTSTLSLFMLTLCFAYACITWKKASS